MKLARSLQLPTGMAMTFVCRPARVHDPAAQAQDAAVIELFAPVEPSVEDAAEPALPHSR